MIEKKRAKKIRKLENLLKVHKNKYCKSQKNRKLLNKNVIK